MQCSVLLSAKAKGTSIAKMAEKLLSCRLDIAGNGEMVTEAATVKFVGLFQGRLPATAIDDSIPSSALTETYPLLLKML